LPPPMRRCCRSCRWKRCRSTPWTSRQTRAHLSRSAGSRTVACEAGRFDDSQIEENLRQTINPGKVSNGGHDSARGQSPQELGRSRCRRTDQAERQYHHRTSQRQHTVACDVRTRLRKARGRRAARSRRPPIGTEGGAHELSQPEGASRKRRIARFGFGRLLSRSAISPLDNPCPAMVTISRSRMVSGSGRAAAAASAGVRASSHSSLSCCPPSSLSRPICWSPHFRDRDHYRKAATETSTPAQSSSSTTADGTPAPASRSTRSSGTAVRTNA
jgi:hypothetical protein